MPIRKRQEPFLPGFRKAFREAREKDNRGQVHKDSNSYHQQVYKLFNRMPVPNLKKTIKNLKEEIQKLQRIKQQENQLGESRDARETEEEIRKHSKELKLAEKAFKEKERTETRENPKELAEEALKERKKLAEKAFKEKERKKAIFNRVEELETYIVNARKIVARSSTEGATMEELNRFFGRLKKGRITNNDINEVKRIICDIYRTHTKDSYKIIKEIREI